MDERLERIKRLLVENFETPIDDVTAATHLIAHSEIDREPPGPRPAASPIGHVLDLLSEAEGESEPYRP